MKHMKSPKISRLIFHFVQHSDEKQHSQQCQVRETGYKMHHDCSYVNTLKTNFKKIYKNLGMKQKEQVKHIKRGTNQLFLGGRTRCKVFLLSVYPCLYTLSKWAIIRMLTSYTGKKCFGHWKSKCVRKWKCGNFLLCFLVSSQPKFPCHSIMACKFK